jgi:hypothetical protein
MPKTQLSLNKHLVARIQWEMMLNLERILVSSKPWSRDLPGKVIK